ncbi:cell division protein FtsA [Methylobacterium sp. WL30]|uniref:cell division protein FtsA n=1 Tax=Methylobacterium sp. WL30 TaxID=2603895 RepID=UPI0011CB60A5|nr:cell division protein FtsA [Methylobacterium sp. WL30]TXN68510.1 cell division protein FtsA [Methylobacterium sp. WL30]
MHSQHGLTPRLKPLSARRSTTLSVLDIGTSKVVCLIAELQPAEALTTLKGRTHLARIIGIGHQRSHGLKGGAIVDLEAAEGAIRQAVHAAERMAKVEVQSVIVNMSGGRLASQHFQARVNVRTGTVTGADVERVLETASAHGVSPGRAVLHALPTGYALDGQGAVIDPSGMIGEALMVAVHGVGEDEGETPNHVPRSQLVRIIKPRVEEVVELVRDRLRAAGFAAQAGRRVVLTGGASQLVGLPEVTRRVMQGQVRIGRPLGIRGLPEAAKGPAFSAAVGLLVYPQVAHAEHFEPRGQRAFAGTGTDGYIGRVYEWLKQGF